LRRRSSLRENNIEMGISCMYLGEFLILKSG
jgi:hypothetical protein